MTVWTPERKAEFRRLWAVRPKIPTSEICRRLGVNINQLVGARRRLGLEPRNNPVKRRSEPARAVPGLPGAQSASAGALEPYTPPVAAKPGCQWPLGHPGEPDFRFCGQPVSRGKSYCAEHCSRAYISKSSYKSAGPKVWIGPFAA